MRQWRRPSTATRGARRTDRRSGRPCPDLCAELPSDRTLHRRNPELSKVLLRDGPSLVSSDKGLAPRARRDIEAAARAGRFNVRDPPELALTITAGAALCLGQLLHDHPERDDAEDTDQVTEDLLRMFGLSADEAREICRRPLPDTDDQPRGATAT